MYLRFVGELIKNGDNETFPAFRRRGKIKKSGLATLETSFQIAPLVVAYDRKHRFSLSILAHTSAKLNLGQRYLRRETR
jgi:hypothetical protein